MEKFTYQFVLGIVNISLIVGALIGKVGESTSCSGKVVDWTLPFSGLGTVFILGLYGRKK